MDFQTELKNFKEHFDVELARFFDVVSKEAQEKGIPEALLAHTRRIVLGGGKRVRPTLVWQGYLGAGGKDEEKILRLAVGVELSHAYLLMHDDIIDQDGIRHGILTLERFGEQWAHANLPHRDTRHFGLSVALIMGDLLSMWGERAFLEAGFTAKQTLDAMGLWRQVLEHTGIGETLDILLERLESHDIPTILKMYEYKTARYTFVGPLQLGGVLAGADRTYLDGAERFGLPVGLSFQMQDDWLGAYGSEESLGKPVGSDLRQGKITLLTAYLFKAASKEERKRLRFLLKKGRNITMDDVIEYRQLLEATGTAQRVRNEIQRTLNKAKEQLQAWPSLAPENRSWLMAATDYMAEREL